MDWKGSQRPGPNAPVAPLPDLNAMDRGSSAGMMEERVMLAAETLRAAQIATVSTGQRKTTTIGSEIRDLRLKIWNLLRIG